MADAEQAGKAASPRSAFARWDFRLYQTGRFLSIIGTQMQAVAVGWQVYAITGRKLDLGLVGLAQFLPFILFSLAGGQAADRFDRRRVLLVCYLLQVACALLLLGFAVAGMRDVRFIYGALALFGTARAFSAPAASALLPHLVPQENFSQAIAIGSSVRQVATISGPALGGLLWVLYGVSDGGGPAGAASGARSGASLVYAVSAAAALCALVALAAMRIRTGRLEKGEISWKTLLAGVRFVRSKRILLGSISLDLFAVFLGGAVALLPVYAQDILRVGPLGLGLLRSAPALGAATMAAVLARWPLKRRAGARMLVCVMGFGIATIVFGLSRSFALSLASLAVLGALDNVSVVIRLTLEQIATPPPMRGRVSAVNMMFIGASNELGDFESGLTAQLFGTVPAVVAGGVGTCVVVALWSWLFPELRKVDRLEDA
jgi:MFS family permease